MKLFLPALVERLIRIHEEHYHRMVDEESKTFSGVLSFPCFRIICPFVSNLAAVLMCDIYFRCLRE